MSVKNWRIAPILRGPLQITGSSIFSSRKAMDTTFMPYRPVAGKIPGGPDSNFAPFNPIIRGTLGPRRSASRIPTLPSLPFIARAVARLTVAKLFPTPPFPLIIAILCLTLDIRVLRSSNCYAFFSKGFSTSSCFLSSLI